MWQHICAETGHGKHKQVMERTKEKEQVAPYLRLQQYDFISFFVFLLTALQEEADAGGRAFGARREVQGVHHE